MHSSHHWRGERERAWSLVTCPEVFMHSGFLHSFWTLACFGHYRCSRIGSTSDVCLSHFLSSALSVSSSLPLFLWCAWWWIFLSIRMHRSFLLIFCFVFCWSLELGGFLYLRACAPTALELIFMRKAFRDVIQKKLCISFIIPQTLCIEISVHFLFGMRKARRDVIQKTFCISFIIPKVFCNQSFIPNVFGMHFIYTCYV